MDKLRPFIDFLKSKKFLRTLLWMFLVLTLFVIGGLIFLHIYTRHNESIQVPDVKGVAVETAAPLLQNAGLRVEVVDSVYTTEVPKGAIIDQVPPAGARVKNNRIIFVTVNAKSELLIPLPDIRELSQRQAMATLNALGFKIARVETQPSRFAGLVLDVRSAGRSVESGTKLSLKNSLTLVVGAGGEELSDSSVVDPDLPTEEDPREEWF